MPSSLVVVALVLAWLVVLVPMIVRKRQEVAKTADSELAARVVRSGSGEAGTEAEMAAEEADMREPDGIDEDLGEELADSSATPVAEHAPEDAADEDTDQDDRAVADMTDPPAYYDDYGRRYRPGRGGFDPEAAAIIARAKYAYRQRVVLAMLIGAVVTAVVAAVVFPTLWWAHGAIDVVLVSYLVYLRRQVRIETEIRERRLARMNRVRRARPRYVERPVEQPAETDYRDYQPEREADYEADYDEYDAEEPGPRERVADGPGTPIPPVSRHGAVVVDVDDEDPAFDDLDEPGTLPYRRAVGE